MKLPWGRNDRQGLGLKGFRLGTCIDKDMVIVVVLVVVDRTFWGRLTAAVSPCLSVAFGHKGWRCVARHVMWGMLSHLRSTCSYLS